jgi:hypothetical protein
MKNERKACGEDAALGRLLDAAEIRIDAAANERVLARLSALPARSFAKGLASLLAAFCGRVSRPWQPPRSLAFLSA